MKRAYPTQVTACGVSLLYLNLSVVKSMMAIPIMAEPPIIVVPCAASCIVRLVEWIA